MPLPNSHFGKLYPPGVYDGQLTAVRLAYQRNFTEECNGQVALANRDLSIIIFCCLFLRGPDFNRCLL